MKRKAGKREKNGRIKRKTAQETAYEAKAPVLERRCMVLGISPTLDNMKRVDKYGGTPWGMAYLFGGISLRQFHAADEWAVIRAAHDAALGLPPRTAQGGDVLAPGGRSCAAVEDAEADRRKIVAYQNLRSAVGTRAAAVEAFIDASGVVNVNVLVGLCLAADHLRIEVGEQSL